MSPASTSAMSGDRPRLAIMASGRGSNAAALIDAAASGALDADVVLVVCDQPGAGVLTIAEERGVPVAVIERTAGAEAHEAAILDALASAGAGILLLAGYLRVLSGAFIEGFGGPILNIHPSLLPDFPGLDVVAQQWEAGVTVAGATVHFVDAGVDTGPILLQGALIVQGDEGADGLARRILTEVEHHLYPRAVRMLLQQMTVPDSVDQPIRRALLSVSDKEGIADLAAGLVKAGVTVLASGGTASTIEAAGVPVTSVEEVTGAAEVLGGRVKTLHPAVHAGILADRRRPEHQAELAEHGYGAVDLVVCNLYPFEEAVASGASRDEVIEQIDIGGPTLIRAAAKNADGGVTVVVDPADYGRLLSWVEAGLAVPEVVRRDLAATAFARVADYDAAIDRWMSASPALPFERPRRVESLRYGENPHQEGRLYVDGSGRGVAAGRLLTGMDLSYTNLLDLDAAYRAVYGDGPHRCSIVKHTNPCGLAESDEQAEAFRRALSGDPMASFGCVIGLNQPLGAATAQAIIDARLLVHCIAAPGFDDGARALLAKRKDLRLVEVPPGDPAPDAIVHAIGGGMLVEDIDTGPTDPEGWRVVTDHQPDADTVAELGFAMRAVSVLKSNAISVTSERTLRGAGAGLMSRVDACRLAIEKAGEHAAGAVMASDAFFPFDDAVRLAADAGIVAVAQPGGSVRDEEVIDACNQLGLSMVFTGTRHFRH